MRHKGLKSIGITVESKEGERGSLCRNKANVRSPSLGFNPNHDECIAEEHALEHLASILVGIYLSQNHAE